jgi:hypothetical protein
MLTHRSTGIQQRRMSMSFHIRSAPSPFV